MKFTALLLIPISASAFAPAAKVAFPKTALFNEVDDICETVTSKAEDVLQKTDEIALSRVMRVVDHAPLLFTLKTLADKAGMSISRSGITAATASFGGLSTALPVATWACNVYALAAIVQLASVAKSALADGGNELSQGAITAAAATNWAVARAIGSANPLLDTALVAVISGHSLRTGSNDGSVQLHTAALQLVSSFTSVLTILGGVSALAGKLSFINAQATSVLGLAAYYGLATRSGNGTIRKIVNAGVIAGVLISRLSGGIKLSFDAASIVGGATTLGAAYVAYEAVNRARQAIMD